MEGKEELLYANKYYMPSFLIGNLEEWKDEWNSP